MKNIRIDGDAILQLLCAFEEVQKQYKEQLVITYGGDSEEEKVYVHFKFEFNGITYTDEMEFYVGSEDYKIDFEDDAKTTITMDDIINMKNIKSSLGEITDKWDNLKKI